MDVSIAVSHGDLLRQDQVHGTGQPRGIDTCAVVADFGEAWHVRVHRKVGSLIGKRKRPTQ